MADNVVVTAGSGTTVHADEYTHTVLGSGKTQLVKIVDGTLDAETPLKVIAEDVALTGGEGMLILAAQRKATPVNNSGTDGDAEYLQMNNGALWTSPLCFPVTVQTDITRPSDTIAYSPLDCLSDSTLSPTNGGFTFTNAARKSGGSGVIIDATFATSADASTRLSGEIYLFNTAVTNVIDNASLVVSDTEIKTCVGVIPFTMFDAGNNGFCHLPGLNVMFTCSGSANLRFLVRVRNAYTPVSAEVLTCTLKILQLD